MRHNFYLYTFVLGIIYIIEATMGYYFPIVVERSLGSNFSAGLIIGFTNLAAIACDIAFPQLFSKKNWKFLLLAAVILQIGYPAFTNLGILFSSAALYIVAALFWNVYFEFFAFSRNSFITEHEKKEYFSRDWGVISVVLGISSIIGPILGSSLLRTTLLGSSLTFGALQACSIIFALALVYIIPSHPTEEIKSIKSRFLPFKEFSYWKVIGPAILPVLTLGLMINILSASITLIGGLLGERAFGAQNLGWLLIFLSVVPSIFISVVFSTVGLKSGKKYASQILLAMTAVSLILVFFSRHSPWMLAFLFVLQSIFAGGAWIFNQAVYSDLMKRSQIGNLHINSLERIDESVSWLIGPILIGFLADKTDYYGALGILGGVMLMVALVLLAFTPKKINLPQQELKQVA